VAADQRQAEYGGGRCGEAPRVAAASSAGGGSRSYTVEVGRGGRSNPVRKKLPGRGPS
jgi:hypothetical protein